MMLKIENDCSSYMCKFSILKISDSQPVKPRGQLSNALLTVSGTKFPFFVERILGVLIFHFGNGDPGRGESPSFVDEDLFR
jgi:hypothetical protein